MVSNIVGGIGSPKLGDPVHAVFDRVDDTLTLPKFAMGPKP
jgi:hypothetical protein